MAILEPTKLEDVAYGQQGWNGVLNANMQKLNTYLTRFRVVWDTTQAPADKALLRYNAAAKTWEAVTGYTGQLATATHTLEFAGGVLISATEIPVEP